VIYSHCAVRIFGAQDELDAFIKAHGLTTGWFSFSTLVPTTGMDDEALLAAWGCSSGPEPLGSNPVALLPGGLALRFRCAGGPPVAWVAKVAQMNPRWHIELSHATEATAVHGDVSYFLEIRRVNEVEGDSQATDARVDNLSQ